MWAAVAIGSDTHIWREGVYVYPVPPPSPLSIIFPSTRTGPPRCRVSVLPESFLGPSGYRR